MAVTVVHTRQGAVYKGDADQTRMTLTLDIAPAVGRLLRVVIAGDKSVGTWGPAPAGWTYESAYAATSVGAAGLYRVADGTAADTTATVTWSTPTPALGIIREYDLTGAVLQAAAVSPVDESDRSFVGPLDAGQATGPGVAFADWAVDSSNGQGEGDPAFTGGYTRTYRIANAGTGDPRNPQGNNLAFNAGNLAFACASKELTAGSDTATTASMGPAAVPDQMVLRVTRYSVTAPQSPPAPPPGPAAPVVAGVEVGAVTPTSAVIAYDLDRAAATRAVVSTSPTLTAPIYGTQASTDTAKSAVTGLAGQGVYHWGVEADGVLLAAPRGTFTTPAPAGTRSSFTALHASCAGKPGSPFVVDRVSNAPVFDRMREVGALLQIHPGDDGYFDYEGTDTAVRVANRKRTRAQPRQRALHLASWKVYHPDDHDGAGNNWDAAHPGKPSMLAAYAATVPHFPLPVAGTTAQAFDVGRVAFIMLDPRSARVVGATTLGAPQRAWALDQLATTTARLVVLDTSLPWIGDGVTGSDAADGWGGYPDDRRAIAAGITGYEARTGGRVVITAGDMHAIAVDDGEHSQYDPARAGQPGPPVFQFAPLDANSTQKGGPYTVGPLTGATGTFLQQFGTLAIDDSAADGSLSLTATGWRVAQTAPYAKTQLVQRVVRVAAAAPVAPPTPSGPAGPTWSLWNGTTEQPLTVTVLDASGAEVAAGPITITT